MNLIKFKSANLIIGQFFPDEENSTSYSLQKGINEPIKIAWFKRPKWLPLTFNFSECGFSNCILSDKTKSLDNYEAIIFHYRYLSKKVPEKSKNQIWIIWINESPANDKSLPKQWQDKFDWSATYRKESEFSLRRSIKLRENKINRNYTDILRRKTKQVSWVVSNCKTPSQRRRYVEELKKYITVDIYGHCGENKMFCKNKSAAECHSYLSNEYKFYLGFENSLCQDYITEKVFNNFLDNNTMIYVARGAPNLKSVIPANTMVNTEDFESPKTLAQYLLKLSSNETEYISYLKETDKYYLTENRIARAFCSICELLNTYKNRKLKWTGRNFNVWYRKGACIRPNNGKGSNGHRR
ncbi:glycoprotein 3-alpha-L-fucosyltransferase A-like [Mytilus californianus]|uniref:glycoprotein 3-alpha-L-fucosyltransferase A-like n=1 Tax=Mytilus californianus TaxID=6549 RepID=UPI002247D2E8|nr:glycoprotein 3-alpha-L-fucosyltransferase A-like [Mytilus californianus]